MTKCKITDRIGVDEMRCSILTLYGTFIRKEEEEERLLTVADEDRTLQARVLLLSYLNSDPKHLSGCNHGIYWML